MSGIETAPKRNAIIVRLAVSSHETTPSRASTAVTMTTIRRLCALAKPSAAAVVAITCAFVSGPRPPTRCARRCLSQLGARGEERGGRARISKGGGKRRAKRARVAARARAHIAKPSFHASSIATHIEKHAALTKKRQKPASQSTKRIDASIQVATRPETSANRKITTKPCA